MLDGEHSLVEIRLLSLLRARTLAVRNGPPGVVAPISADTGGFDDPPATRTASWLNRVMVLAERDSLLRPFVPATAAKSHKAQVLAPVGMMIL